MAEAPTVNQRRWVWLAGSTTVLAALAVAWPLLALPAFLTVTLAFIVLEGRLRWIVGGVGGPLMAIAFVRFLLVYAVPNIVVAGEMAAEDKAVSRLREIRWAELQERQLRLVDANQDGEGEFIALNELVGDVPGRLRTPAPLLKPGLYRSAEPTRTVYRSDAYELAVYLPTADGAWTTDPARADPVRASHTFVAYAWPVGEKQGGKRAFVIDQNEQICETSDAGAAVGPEHPPAAAAAFGALPATTCGGPGAPAWHVWKKKKARAESSASPEAGYSL